MSQDEFTRVAQAGFKWRERAERAEARLRVADALKREYEEALQEAGATFSEILSWANSYGTTPARVFLDGIAKKCEQAIASVAASGERSDTDERRSP